MTTIAFTKTSEDLYLDFYGYVIHRELYTGTFSDEGYRGNCTHRQSVWIMDGLLSFGDDTVRNGKPSVLLRGGPDCMPGPLNDQTQTPRPIAVAWGDADDEATDGLNINYAGSYEFPEPFGTISLLCQYLSFDDLSAVSDIYTCLDEMHAHWIQIEGLRYFNTETISGGPPAPTPQGARPVHAWAITGDIPDWYDATPTHIAGEPGVASPFVPCVPATGWHVNPNDQTTCCTARYIGGELCTPAIPGGGYALGRPYVSSGSASLFIGSDSQPFNDAKRSDYMTLELAEDGRVQVAAMLPFHRGTLPDVDARWYGYADEFSAEPDIAIIATCYPGAIDVVVWSETLGSSGYLSETRTGLKLSLTGIPATTSQIRLSAGIVSDYSYNLDIAICQPEHMYGHNPAQTSDWPAVVPGFVRKVSI